MELTKLNLNVDRRIFQMGRFRNLDYDPTKLDEAKIKEDIFKIAEKAGFKKKAIFLK